MIHVYHPSKTIKGFACSFWYSSRNNSVFATLIKQSGWDDKNQNGLFKGNLNDPTKKVTIKLSWVEVGAILDCIDRNRPFSTYHDQDDFPKTIQFQPWTNTLDGKVSQRGFSFSVNVGDKQDSTSKNPFYIGLTYPEARYIREFLLYSLNLSFDGYISRGKHESVVVPAAPPEDPIEKENTDDQKVNNPTSESVEDPLTGF